MPSFKSLGKYIPDYDPSVVLANRTTVVAVTTIETGIALNNQSQAYWDGGETTAGLIGVGITVPTANRTGTETYTFSLQVGNSVFAAPVTVATTAPFIGPGSTRLFIDAEELQRAVPLNANRTHMRLVMTVGGAGTPAVTYFACFFDGDEE